jgi:transcriptional regulator with XRE-family HTH domain
MYYAFSRFILFTLPGHAAYSLRIGNQISEFRYSHGRSVNKSKKHRLELHWLQKDVAAKIEISSTSVSNWERGITSPSRRMTKRIREFLDYSPKLIPKVHRNDFHCQTCGISNTSSECCLFEEICNSFTENEM